MQALGIDIGGSGIKGSPVDEGGGRYSVTVTAGTVPGVDVLRVAADDGIRPVVLMPDRQLRVGVPGEVRNLGWTSPSVLRWDAAPKMRPRNSP